METYKASVEALRKEANVTPADFVLRNAVGKAYLFIKGGWIVNKGRDEQRRFERVGFLVERRDDGQIRILSVLPECSGLFGPETRTFCDPGKNYEGLHYPLRQMLRMLYAVFQTLNGAR